MTRQDKRDDIEKRLKETILAMHLIPNGTPAYDSEKYALFIETREELLRFTDESKKIHDELWEQVMRQPYKE